MNVLIDQVIHIKSDDEFLVEELKCCENEDDIQAFVDTLIAKFITNSYKEQVEILRNHLYQLSNILWSFAKQHDEYFSLQNLTRERNHLKEKFQDSQKIQEDQQNEISLLNDFIQKQKTDILFFETKMEEIEVYCSQLQGNEQELQKLNIKQLSTLEQRMLFSLKSITSIKNAKIENDGNANTKSCVICFTNPYNILIHPCEHVCVCEQCSVNVNKCPVCRQRIISVKKIYLS